VNAPSFPGTGQANTVLAPLTLTGSQLSASLIVDVPQRTQTGTYNLSVSANSPNATLSPPTINLNLSVNPINDAVFVSQNLPDYLYPSEVRSGSVTMQNTGSTTWSAAVAYRLGFPNPGAAGPFAPNNWNSGRVDVPANVTPGQNTTFNFNLTAPTTPGTFTFQSQMVQENVQWFGQFTAAKSIVVGYPDLVVTDFSINSANPTVGQPATFTVTVLNQGTNPTPAGVPIGIGFYANGAGLGVAAFAATPLAPGQSSTVTSNAWTPSVGGAQAITAFVDDINRLGSTEANKANNTLTKTVNIVGPSVRILDSTGGDITGSTQNVLVGQQIILQTRIDNAPAGTNPTGTWTIPGSVGTIPIPGSTGSPAFAIGGWNPVVTGSGSPTLLSTQTLSQPSVTFYYVSPSNPPPASGTGQQTVSYKVNINGADYTGSVILNIRRPKASVVASILSSVLVGFQNGNCSSNPIISLKFGDTCQSDLSDAGISFTQTGENAPGGTYNFIQVLNTQFQSGTKQAATSSTGGDSLIAAPALSNLLDTATNAKDTNIFYPRNQTTPVKSSDSPSSSLTNVNSYGRADSFSTWLVYNPGTPQGINVPLQKFNWSWQGNVPRSLNGRNGAFQTTPAGSIAGAATIGSIPVDTLEFPFWGNGPANNFSSPISSSIPINSVLGGSTSGTVAAGSTLRLNGTFYDFATGKFNVASVTVNGTPAAYSIPDTSTLVITVSSGTPAGSALISITSTNGLITSVPVTVVPGIPPTITSFTPAAGLPYSKVTINGSGFSATSSVSFGSLPTGYIVNSDTQITATVPVILGIPPVRIIVVTPFGSAVSSASFQVTPPTLFRVVTEDGALPVLRAFSQYYTGYPSAPNSPTGSPRNSAVRFNYVPSSRTTTVGCFTGASACP
jgi:CARDB